MLGEQGQCLKSYPAMDLQHQPNSQAVPTGEKRSDHHGKPTTFQLDLMSVPFEGNHALYHKLGQKTAAREVTGPGVGTKWADYL